MLTDIKKFLRVLVRERVINTIYPTLHLWILYVLLVLILLAIFSTAVATLVSVVGIIFWFGLSEKVKEAFRMLWFTDLPALKFHFVGICIELGVVAVVILLIKPPVFISSLLKKYGK